MGNILINKLLGILSIVILFIAAIYISKEFLIISSPFLLGYLISKIFIPVINRFKIKHKHLLTAITFIMLLLFILLSSMIIYFLGKYIIVFLSNIVNNDSQIKNQLLDYYYQLKSNSINLPFNIKFDFSKIVEDITKSSITFIADRSQSIIESSFKFIKVLPQILVYLIITLISAFFFTKDYKVINRTMNTYFSKPIKKIKSNDYYLLIKNNIFHVLFGYLRAQLILISITLFISSIGLYLIGINNFFFKALFISILDALPLFGTAIILVPWAISKFILGNYITGISMLILYTILTITRQSIEPKIFGDQIGLYPLLTLFSIYAGLKTIGFIGLFIGPIAVIVSKSIFDYHKNTNVS